jgi:hypothetical protein
MPCYEPGVAAWKGVYAVACLSYRNALLRGVLSHLLQVLDGLQFVLIGSSACIDLSPSSQLPRVRYVPPLVLRGQSTCHGPLPRRSPEEHWSRRAQSLREVAALLGVTAAQDGKVSDVRTSCHIDVTGLTLDPWHCHSRAACVQTKKWHKTC